MIQKPNILFKENRLKIIGAVILFLIAGIVFFCEKFSFEVLKPLPGANNGIYKYIICAALFMSGIFVFVKKTYHISLYIVGCVSTLLLFEGINNAKHNNLFLWIVSALFVLWVVSCLYFALKSAMQEIGAKKQLIKENTDLKNRIKELEESNRQIKINHAGHIAYLEKQYKDNTSKQVKEYPVKLDFKEEESNKLLLKNRHLEIRLYESQLVGLFEFTLQDVYQGQSYKPFGLHYWQGNLDMALADFIGQTNYTYWMLELKREEKDLASELKKEKRMIQFNALESSQNQEIKNISDKCHWLGWGVGNVDISFSSYRKAITCLHNKTVPQREYGLQEFSINSFSDKNPVGVARNDFYIYIKFLLESIGGTISDIENTQVIIYCKDSGSGAITAKLETLFSIRECIQELEQKLDLERKNQQDKDCDLSL